MLLSCVVRTGQRFGAAHVIDVLRGKDTAKIRQHRHAGLSTYGIGEDRSDTEWRSVIRQLLVQGYLHHDTNRYGALTLTGKARPLLRGEVTMLLREDKKTKRQTKVARENYTLEPHEQALWDALRDRRKQLADEAEVPPYVVFHDATLIEMVRLRPSSTAELLNLHGVGQAKLDRYGAAFLAVLNDQPTAQPSGPALSSPPSST